MSQKRWQELAFCFSLAGLLLLKEWAFLNWALEGVYPVYPIRSGDLLVFFSALLLIALPIWGLLIATRSLPRARHWLYFALLLLLVLPLNFLRDKTNLSVNFPMLSVTWMIAWFGKTGAVLLGGVVIALVAWTWHRLGDRGLSLFRALVLCGFPFLVISFAKAGFAYIKHPSLDTVAAPPTSQKAFGPVRVVWVVFDEWDYQATFERRPKDVRLPELDRFREEGLFATHAYAPQIHTHASLPAYLLGRQLHSFCRLPGNDIQVAFPPLLKPQPLASLSTVLSDLADEGARISVTGWYHPYCTLLAGHPLVSCESEMYYDYGRPGEFLPRLASLGWRTFNPKQQSPDQHLDNYRKLRAAALKHAADPSVDLAFIHLSIPHLPGIFDRVSGKLISDRRPTGIEDEWNDYYSNLVLLDRTVGELREAITKSGERTVLFLTSDHSIHAWRFGLKNPDRRVPFMVSGAGVAPQEVKHPFNTVLAGALARDLIEGLEVAELPERIQALSKVGPIETGEPTDLCPSNEM